MLSMKKGIGSALSLTVAFTTLVACSSGGVENNATGDQPVPKDDKPFKFTWYYTPNPSKLVKNIGEMEGMKEIMRRTNVQIEFQEPTAGEKNQQFNIMLASGNYPDVVFWDTDVYPGGLTKLLQDGVAIKLNDLIDKYAPNYKKLLDSNPELKRQATLDDGSIVHFPKVELDLTRMSYSGLQVRKDWLDKLGLKVPTTVDEWYEVAKAFKEKDPNGNGKPDEIPFAADKGAGTIKTFAGAWGTRVDAFFISPKTQKMTFGPIEPGYKEYITTMAKWFKEGLIDPEFASIDSKALDARIADNKTGVWRGASSWFAKWDQLMKPNNPNFKIVGAPFVTGPAGKPYTNSDTLVQIISGEGAFII